MKVGRWKSRLAAAMATTMLATMTAYPLGTAIARSAKGIMMYEDTRTGAFPASRAGRVAVGTLYLGGRGTRGPAAVVQEQVQKEVKKHDEELRTEFMQNQTVLLQKNAELSKQVAEIKPAGTDYMDNFKNKFRLGTLIYADWRMYSHTTYMPQSLPRSDNPGIRNNWYNGFDVSRAYMNFFFFPTPDALRRHGSRPILSPTISSTACLQVDRIPALPFERR